MTDRSKSRKGNRPINRPHHMKGEDWEWLDQAEAEGRVNNPMKPPHASDRTREQRRDSEQ